MFCFLFNLTIRPAYDFKLTNKQADVHNSKRKYALIKIRYALRIKPVTERTHNNTPL